MLQHFTALTNVDCISDKSACLGYITETGLSTFSLILSGIPHAQAVTAACMLNDLPSPSHQHMHHAHIAHMVYVCLSGIAL